MGNLISWRASARGLGSFWQFVELLVLYYKWPLTPFGPLTSLSTPLCALGHTVVKYARKSKKCWYRSKKGGGSEEGLREEHHKSTHSFQC